MKRIQNLAMTTVAAAMTSAGALAHGGHPVPAGVPVESHLHLAETVVVSGSLLVTVMLAGAALGALLWRRRAIGCRKANQVDCNR